VSRPGAESVHRIESPPGGRQVYAGPVEGATGTGVCGTGEPVKGGLHGTTGAIPTRPRT